MLIWDTNTLNPLTILKPAYVGAILALTYHPNGDSFAAGGENASITVWEPDETWRLSRSRTDAEREMEFSYPQIQVEGVREEDRWRLIHQVSGYSAVSGCMTSVEAYEACPEGFVEAYQADGQIIDLQPAHIMNLPEHMTFNADGTKLAVTACQTLSGYNCLNSIWIWSLPDGTVKEIVTPIVRINHLLFSPDGRYLAYGGEGRDIMLFDLSNDRETRLPLLNWPGQVTDLRFSPDGTRLAASASFEDPGPYANTINHGRIMVWDTASGSAIAHSSMRGWMVAGLGFSEDGQILQFVIQEGPGEGDGDPGPIWLLGLDQWQQIACRIANRDLTEREWQRYVIGEEYRQVCT
jgi:WD40 repeat protein